MDPPEEDEEELQVRRNKTIKNLARRVRQRQEKPSCSPSVYLTLVGLVISSFTLTVGIPVFNMQWRRYGALWGGYLEWHCTLVSCHLTYTYPGSHPNAALRMKNFVMPLAKKVLQPERVEEADAWIDNFAAGNAESFPPLFNLPLCAERSFRGWLFRGFCETSTWSGKFIGGTVWSIVKKASRTGLGLTLLSLVMNCGLFMFVAVDHQTFRRPDTRRPRWAVSEMKTAKFRPVAKVAAGLSPACVIMSVLGYRMSIQNFERVGGVARQAVGVLASDQGDFQMPWGCVWYLLTALFQLAISIALLRGPLRKPEIPVALDVVDIQLERQANSVELAAYPRGPRFPGRPGPPGPGPPGPGPPTRPPANPAGQPPGTWSGTPWPHMAPPMARYMAPMAPRAPPMAPHMAMPPHVPQPWRPPWPPYGPYAHPQWAPRF